ncbi:MAG: NPCBM/NEW2 domain-containing protein [Candidatus Omnitrophica bacterium]|nr:NPCBM/NEW2 domain-containing protein [Candidatus Omnitrophota bacterium]
MGKLLTVIGLCLVVLLLMARFRSRDEVRNQAQTYQDEVVPPGYSEVVKRSSDPKIVYLSDVRLDSQSQEIGKINKDLSFHGFSLCLDKVRYEKGLGVHANSEIVYSLDSRYDYFESYIGLDDAEDDSSGSVVFTVFIDGQKTYESPVMRWNSKTEHVKIQIKDKQKLKLKVTDAGDGINTDQADWADAKLYLADSQ